MDKHFWTLCPRERLQHAASSDILAAHLGLTETDLAAPSDGPKRILTIEGGGVRGIFSLQILKQMEQVLREITTLGPNLVLADHFHLIVGTSVGAIVATFLSWGWPVGKLCELFETSLDQIFSRARWKEIWSGAFLQGPLRRNSGRPVHEKAMASPRSSAHAG